MLITAAQGLANFLITSVIPALVQLFQWVATNLPPALQKLAQFWTGTLQPALAQVWAFIQGSVIPILQQVFAWLATNLPPALQKLAQFWTGTLQPALAAVWAFIQGSVIPVLQQVFAWLATNLPPALQTLAQFWTGTLQPALAAVWSFLQTSVIPIFQEIFTWLAMNLPPALQTLADFWNNTLLPAITAVWQFIQTNLVPLFEALANLYIAGLKLALAGLALIWDTVLKPALTALWEFLRDHIKGALVDVKAVLDGPLGTALRAFATLVEGAVATALGVFEGAVRAVSGAISGITDAINTVIGWIDRLKEKLSNLTLPSWLTPGSPTPFEIGLLGIGDAMKSLSQQDIPQFGRGLESIGAATDRLLAALLESTPAELQELAEALGAVMQAIQTTLDAFADLTAFVGVNELGAKLDLLAEHIHAIALKFYALALFFADPANPSLVSVKAVLDPLAEIFVNLQDVVEGFQALALLNDFKLNVDAALTMLRDVLPRLVEGLAQAAGKMDQAGLPAAVRLAQAAGAIGKELEAAITGIQLAMSFRLSREADGTDVFIEALRSFVARLTTMANMMGHKVFDAAVRLAAAAGAIGKNVQDAITGIQLAMSFRLSREADGTDVFIEALRSFVARLTTTANLMDHQAFDAAVRLAVAAGSIGANVQDAILGMTLAMEYRSSRMADGTALFVSHLQQFVLALVEGGRLFDEDGLKAATALAEAAGKIGTNVEDAILGMTAVAEYAGLELTAGARLFADDAAVLVRELSSVAVQFETAALSAAKDFADAAGSIGNQIESAIAGMRAIMDYAGGLAATAVTRLATDLATMVDGLVLASGAFDGDGLAAAQALAEAAGAIGSSISATVEGLQAIMAYAGGLTQEAIDRLVVDLQLMVQGLQAAAFAFSESGLAAAERLATAAGVIGDGVSSLADAMQEIINYVAPSPERIDELAADMYTVVEKFRIVAAVLGEDGIAQAERFALAGAAIYQAIEDGIDSVLGIANSGAMGGVGNAMDEMVAQVLGGMEGMAEAFTEMVGDAFDFGAGWVDAIMDGLESRLGDLEVLMAYIRGLFPSSPAEHGAWSDLPDGEAVGERFTSAMASAVAAGSSSVAEALAGLRSAFGMDPQAGAAGGQYGAGGGISITVNVQGDEPGQVREAANLGVMEAARALGWA